MRIWWGLWLAACGVEMAPPAALPDAGLGAQPLPDFALQDLSSTSASAGQRVSPRAYLGRASGWYFSHAT